MRPSWDYVPSDAHSVTVSARGRIVGTVSDPGSVRYLVSLINDQAVATQPSSGPSTSCPPYGAPGGCFTGCFFSPDAERFGLAFYSQAGGQPIATVTPASCGIQLTVNGRTGPQLSVGFDPDRVMLKLGLIHSCAVGQVQPSVNPVVPLGNGVNRQALEYRNVSSAICTIVGTPHLTLLDASGQPLAAKIAVRTPKHSSLYADIYRPGHVLVFYIVWRQTNATCAGPSAATVVATLSHAAKPFRFPVRGFTFKPCGGSISLS